MEMLTKTKTKDRLGEKCLQKGDGTSKSDSSLGQIGQWQEGAQGIEGSYLSR